MVANTEWSALIPYTLRWTPEPLDERILEDAVKAWVGGVLWITRPTKRAGDKAGWGRMSADAVLALYGIMGHGSGITLYLRYEREIRRRGTEFIARAKAAAA